MRKYETIAAYLRAEIDAGKITDKLPSESWLMDCFDVAAGTVRQALRVLHEDGLTEARQGKGVYIRRSHLTKDPREQDFNLQVGVRVRARRTAIEMSQTALAKAVGVSRQSVSNWEAGRVGISVEHLGPLSNALGTTVEELLPKVTPLPPLVTVQVRTRNPTHYRLVNTDDGSEWVIRDGTWKRA